MRHYLFAVLVGSELAEEFFGRDALAGVFLRAELRRDGEERHDRRVVDGVGLHLIQYLERVGKRFGHVGEYLVHLLARLEPLLLRVEHTRRVVKLLSGREAEQVVVSLGVLLVDEVAVVGADHLYAVLLCELQNLLVGTLLQRECLAVGALVGIFHLVALKLQIVVVSEHTLMPFDGFASTGNVALQYLRRHLASDTCRADDEVLVILLEVGSIGTRFRVETVHPGTRHELDEILVSVVVLRKHDEVIAARVALLLDTVGFGAARNVHLATEYWLERLLALVFQLAVYLVAVVEQLFHAEHIAMVGDSHAAHAVSHGFVDKLFHRRLSVENGVVGVYVQVYEVFHRAVAKFLLLNAL